MGANMGPKQGMVVLVVTMIVIWETGGDDDCDVLYER